MDWYDSCSCAVISSGHRLTDLTGTITVRWRTSCWGWCCSCSCCSRLQTRCCHIVLMWKTDNERLQTEDMNQSTPCFAIEINFFIHHLISCSVNLCWSSQTWSWFPRCPSWGWAVCCWGTEWGWCWWRGSPSAGASRHPAPSLHKQSKQWASRGGALLLSYSIQTHIL